MRLNMLNMFVLSILILSVGCGGEDAELPWQETEIRKMFDLQ